MLDSMTFQEIRGFVEMVLGNKESMVKELFHYSQQFETPERSFNVDWCICGYCLDSPRMKDTERKCCRERHCISRTERCQNMITNK